MVDWMQNSLPYLNKFAENRGCQIEEAKRTVKYFSKSFQVRYP